MNLREWIPGWAWQSRAFCYRELAVLLRAGVRADRALEVLAERNVGGVATGAWDRSAAAVRAGQPIHQALDLTPWTLPPLERAALAAAETSGHLDTMLDRIAQRLEQRARLLASTLPRLLYPVLLFHLVIVVQALVATPGYPGQALLRAALTAAVLDVVVAWLLTRGWRWAGQSAGAERLPVLGAVLRASGQRQYLEALALLHGAGVDLRAAHAQALAAVARPAARARLGAASAMLQSGGTLSQGLAMSGALDPEVLGMLQIGETAGELEAAATRATTLLEHREATGYALLARVAFVATYILAAVLVGATVLRFYAGYYGALPRY